MVLIWTCRLVMSGTASMGSLVSWNRPQAETRAVARTTNHRNLTEASMMNLNMRSPP